MNLLTAMFLLAVQAQTGWTMHDRFQGRTTLDAAKWAGHAAGEEPLDFLRRIQLEQLDLFSTGYADGELGLRIEHAGAIDVLEARINVDRAVASVCSTASGGTSVAAVLGGRFFRARTDRDDIAAFVELIRRSGESPNAALTARCRIAECDNPDCSEMTDLDTDDFSTVAQDTPVHVSVAWDPAQNLFTCSAGAADQEVHYLDADKFAPADASKIVAVRHAEVCPASDPDSARRTSLQAYVDDVRFHTLADNDTCASELPLALLTSGLSATTTFLDDDYHASAACGPSSGPDAVYTFTLGRRANVRISTLGSSFDTILYLTDASTCTATSPGVELACNNDTRGKAQSTIEVPNLAPGTYRVIVDGVGPGEQGDYTLSLETY